VPLACDNCVPGDASGWYLPLALLGVVAALLAYGAYRLALRRSARRRAVTLGAAWLLLLGPVGAVLALTGHLRWHGVECGSALAASLERGVPTDAALDAAQRGCKDTGRYVVRAAAWGGGGLALAGLVAVAAATPPRRRVAGAAVPA
jgi:hypothetical protein